jgi:excisionase family DNA binding protein
MMASRGESSTPIGRPHTALGTGSSRRSESTRARERSQAGRLLTPAEVAERCRLGRKAIYAAIDRGELPASKICSRLRIRVEDVDAWVLSARIQRDPLPLPQQTESRRFAYAAPNGLRSLVRRGEAST